LGSVKPACQTDTDLAKSDYEECLKEETTQRKRYRESVFPIPVAKSIERYPKMMFGKKLQERNKP